MQMNGGKLVVRLEIVIDSELPLTLFSVTHPSLAAVKVVFWKNNFSPQHQRDRDWARERLLKAFN